MPLLTQDLSIWNFVYPIVEGAFDDDMKVIVHIPLEKTLLDVLAGIGGDIGAFEGADTIIQFK